MSLVSEILEELAEDIIPEIAADVFPDLMDVLAETNTSDGAGGLIKTETTLYEDVPVSYERKELKRRTIEGGKTISTQEYLLTFPTHSAAGTRYSITPNNRLKVLARGNEPVKLFRIISIADDGGVVFEAACTKEN